VLRFSELLSIWFHVAERSREKGKGRKNKNADRNEKLRKKGLKK
jgi:hypothetical protein